MTAPPLHLRHPALLSAPMAAFVKAGVIGLTELSVLDALAGRYGWHQQPLVALGLAFALRAPRAGHVGVVPTRLPERLDQERLRRTEEEDDTAARIAAAWPADLTAWAQTLRGASCVGGPDGDTPFVWQDRVGGGLLMTRRMWQEQRRLADALATRAGCPPQLQVEPAALSGWLDRLFPGADQDEARHAARTVAEQAVAVITGGPGTGKTWGVKRVLAVLLQAAHDAGQPLTVALAAPTGKAAVRLGEAIAEDLDGLAAQGIDAAVLNALRGLEPCTLHRLLGVLPHTPHRFRHGAHHPLAADLIIVDEASMVDLVMTRHLVEAVPMGARLVLLGDRDQLASVEAGTVLADVVAGAFTDGATPETVGPLAPCIAKLTRSWRFEHAAAIACVADALQSRRPDQIRDAVALMRGAPAAVPAWTRALAKDPAPGRITHLPDDGKDGALSDALVATLAAPWLSASVDDGVHQDGVMSPPLPGWAAMLREDLRARQLPTTPPRQRALLDALGRYRVLTAHRRGPRGVEGLSRRLTTVLQSFLEERVGSQRARPLWTQGSHWLGRPVLVTENAYDVGLRNGDVGMVLPVPDPAANGRLRLRAVFPVGTADVRALALSRLPAHETALAMTIHKSQGSQFHRVALVLPSETGSPLLTRELIYTGLTRARWAADWFGTPAVLEDAVTRPIQRASGLASLLWTDPP